MKDVAKTHEAKRQRQRGECLAAIFEGSRYAEFILFQ